MIAREMRMPTCLMAYVTATIVPLAAMCGCSGQTELGQVGGQVTLDGQLQRNVVVILENREAGIFMQAPVDVDGRFEVSTAAGYGLPLATYDIAVRPFEAGPQHAGPNPYLNEAEFVDTPSWAAKWREATTSGLRLIVAPGRNQLNIELSRP
jgi:hypothetical protein